MKRKSLGRGLDALLGPGKPVAPTATDGKSKDATAGAAGGDASGGVQTLAVDLLQRGAMQPRHDMR
ncbi:MAG: chromosome partitioning protein ParB, partial [Verrucomicrobiota bacterium]